MAHSLGSASMAAAAIAARRSCSPASCLPYSLHHSHSSSHWYLAFSIPLSFKSRRRADSVEVMRMSAKRGSSDGFSFGDRLLDYIEGGPKLRKWYGAPDQLPKDGRSEDFKGGDDEQEQWEDDTNDVRDAVLVTGADSETGQLIVLSLILKGARIRVLVKDAKVAMTSFGSYVEPVVGDVMNNASIRKALRGVRAIICAMKVGALADSETIKGVEHIVFLSQLAVYRNGGGLNALLKGKVRQQAEEDEAAIAALGIPYTIIRAGSLQDQPGGSQGFNFQEGCASKGTISREDAAMICVKALDAPPQQALSFEVVNGEEKIEDWKTLFNSLEQSISFNATS